MLCVARKMRRQNGTNKLCKRAGARSRVFMVGSWSDPARIVFLLAEANNGFFMIFRLSPELTISWQGGHLVIHDVGGPLLWLRGLYLTVEHACST